MSQKSLNSSGGNIAWLRAIMHQTLLKTHPSERGNSVTRLVALLVSVCLAFITTNAFGASFWVLGSYLDEPSARSEASRLSRETGIEILIHESLQSDQVRYRIVTGYLTSDVDRQALQQQLNAAGAPEPWVIRFEGPEPYFETLTTQFNEAPVVDSKGSSRAEDISLGEPVDVPLAHQTVKPMDDDVDVELLGEITDEELAEIDEMLAAFDETTATENNAFSYPELAEVVLESMHAGEMRGDFVVAGSFTDLTLARRFSEQLVLNKPVVMSSAKVAGRTFYRVLVGPTHLGEADVVITALKAQQVTGAWLLRDTSVDSEDDERLLALETMERSINGADDNILSGYPDPQSNEAESRRWPGEDSDFNLARLKKAPNGPSTVLNQ